MPKIIICLLLAESDCVIKIIILDISPKYDAISKFLDKTKKITSIGENKKLNAKIIFVLILII